jgi:hypothetical protein
MSVLGLLIRRVEWNPGFYAVVVLTLALSFGANSLLFSAIDRVLLEQSPRPESPRIVRAFQLDELNRRVNNLQSELRGAQRASPTRPFRRYAPPARLDDDTTSGMSGSDVTQRPVMRASGQRPGYKGART